MRDHDTQNGAVLDQFERQAPHYAQLVRSTGRDPRMARLFDALQPRTDQHALDVACGPGKLTLALAQCTAKAIGIDLTPAMIAEAQRAQAESGIGNAHFEVGDALPLPFADAGFDLVVTSASLHHIADPAAVVAEMVRVCKSGGRIGVIDLAPDDDKADAFNASERLRDPSHRRALTADQLQALGPVAGLRELACETYRSKIPLEPVLAASFPEPGNWPRLRALYEDDARSGADRLGLRAGYEDGRIVIHYPMVMTVWQRD